MGAKRWGNALPKNPQSGVDALMALLVEKGVLTAEDIKPKPRPKPAATPRAR